VGPPRHAASSRLARSGRRDRPGRAVSPIIRGIYRPGDEPLARNALRPL
jgi:hypothetical protein